MTTTISAQKVGDPLPEGRRILGDRWTSAFVGDHLWFVSLNGVNQPTYRTFHETPLLGGVVTNFDVRQRRWNKKEIVYEALSSDENLEGRVFGFRHTLLLLTYKKHDSFAFRQLYYWDESQGSGEGRWQPNSLFIDPKTESIDARVTELILTAESDDYVYLLMHDQVHGSLTVSQLDTVGGYGKPGPARIDFLFDLKDAALKGETAKVCCAGVFDHKIWTLFFGHEDPAGSAVRLFSTLLKNGRTEEVDLSAALGGAVLTKPFFGTGGSGGVSSKMHCRTCNRQQASRKIDFAHGLCGSQWVFITNSDEGDGKQELWSIDLREGRWRLLAAAERSRVGAEWSKKGSRISIPSDVEIAAWNDADMEFFGISFETGVYMIDVKTVMDDF